MKDLASLIDHTLLKPDTTKEEIEKICKEAKKYKFASVCINPYYVELVSKNLKGTGVSTTCVIDFPLGQGTSEMKKIETREAINLGAEEIDMVINIGALKDGHLDIVRKDIINVVTEARGRIVKVIIETCLLTKDEKILACKIAKDCGADFVKTSTGFSRGGATIEDVKLMKSIVGEDMGVKASGGVRTLKDAKALIQAGASRIGASSSVDIIRQEK